MYHLIWCGILGQDRQRVWNSLMCHHVPLSHTYHPKYTHKILPHVKCILSDGTVEWDGAEVGVVVTLYMMGLPMDSLSHYWTCMGIGSGTRGHWGHVPPQNYFREKVTPQNLRFGRVCSHTACRYAIACDTRLPTQLTGS